MSEDRLDLVLKTIFMFLGVIIGLPLLISLPSLIYNYIKETKYKKRLINISDDLKSFDIDKKRLEYITVLNEYEEEKKTLISDNEVIAKKIKVKTFDDIIQQTKEVKIKINTPDLSSIFEKYNI
jgi:hypothetical protein